MIDPWDYYTTEDDQIRKQVIWSVIELFAEPARILDIGAGNGFISNDLSLVAELDQLEIDDPMASELKHRVLEPVGQYDLVLATGVLYGHYDYQHMRGLIENHADNIVLTSHYDKVGEAFDKFDKPQIFYAEFPYRDGKQVLRVYQWQ